MQPTTISKENFNKELLLHDLKHFLPTQTPLRDFIHHNSLHAFQHLKFYDAIFKASKIFGFMPSLQLSEFRELYHTGRIRKDIVEFALDKRHPGENKNEWFQKLISDDFDTHNESRIGQLRKNWKNFYRIDLDNAVQPILFRVLCSYLDQGISNAEFPKSPEGFLASLRDLERNGFSSFFSGSKAKKLLLNSSVEIEDLLKMIVGDEKYFYNYLFDQQFTHRGWSGMVATIESFPGCLLDQRKISLEEMIIFELLLEIDALDQQAGNAWKPLASHEIGEPLDLMSDADKSDLNEVLRIWQDAFEWSYYDGVLAGLASAPHDKNEKAGKRKNFQAMFCIDERECSLRRHIEFVAPDSETMGTPGFFGVEFYMQPEGAKFYDKLCPAPVTPKYLIKEHEITGKKEHDIFYHNQTQGLSGGLLSAFSLGYWSLIKLVQLMFRPKMSPAISNAFSHMGPGGYLTIENKNPEDIENGLQIGFTVDEMAARTEGLLRSIGLLKDFAPIVYVIGHGSSSANNPHHGAHDCGACSGRPGSVNARVFAFMANHARVREVLSSKGIAIPADTVFIGGLHDTAADQIEFYDTGILNPEQKDQHIRNLKDFENALDLNAKERSRRFASINTSNSLKEVRKDILDRSVSMFEPRPELGHGTNSLCIIGPRELTKNLFLDRRAFLNSYDYRTDPEGKFLTGLMRPIGPVCGGINLEYYFSRVDNYKLGAGTKLPHNVMGLIGVANSCDGDLRPGLPLQMIEVHDPVRLLIIVEHEPNVVLNCIQSAPEMYEWYINEWVHLVVLRPADKKFYYFKDGAFEVYQPLIKDISSIDGIDSLLKQATEMESNYIVDATKENLPVFTLNHS